MWAPWLIACGVENLLFYSGNLEDILIHLSFYVPNRLIERFLHGSLSNQASCAQLYILLGWVPEEAGGAEGADRRGLAPARRVGGGRSGGGGSPRGFHSTGGSEWGGEAGGGGRARVAPASPWLSFLFLLPELSLARRDALRCDAMRMGLCCWVGEQGRKETRGGGGTRSLSRWFGARRNN